MRRNKTTGFVRGHLAGAALVLAFVLAGCSFHGSSGGEAEGQETVKAGGIVQGGEMYFNEYLALPFAEPEGEYHAGQVWADTFGGRLYILSAYQMEAQKGGWEYFLNVFDPESRKLERKNFSGEALSTEGCYIDSMEVTGEGEMSFRVKYYSDMDAPGFLVVTDMKGETSSGGEAFPEAQEYPWNGEMGENRMVSDTLESTILCQWEPETAYVIQNRVQLYLDEGYALDR